MAKINGSRVIITGASSGIGRAIAFELAQKGVRIVLTSRRLNLLEKVAREINDTFPQVTPPLAAACDVTSREQVRNMLSECLVPSKALEKISAKELLGRTEARVA
jgi:NADP-dependent 3-hydroxy acid dehydrogenase YdfG